MSKRDDKKVKTRLHTRVKSILMSNYSRNLRIISSLKIFMFAITFNYFLYLNT